MDMNFSTWTKQSVDQLIQDATSSNEEKIKKMEDYIKWIASDLTSNQSEYPPINLLIGYYGLVEGKPYDQINIMMTKSYPNEILELVTKMSYSDILSTLTLLSFICNLTRSLPNS
jgi:hypothetical protein